jgi:hypothetical protein
MNILSSPQTLLAVMAAVLLSGGSSGDAIARSQPAPVCPPARAAAAVPADYWVYHALVAPYPTLTPPVSAAPRVRSACTASKVIRT